MDANALFNVLFGGFVAVQVVRALVWLIALPTGAFLDAVLAAEMDEEEDLHALSSARRTRYRALRRRASAAGLNAGRNE